MAEVQPTDEYFLHSTRELERLALQHAFMKDALGCLVKPPIDFTRSPLAVLDSATADGCWIRDLASSLPAGAQVSFVGTDVNADYLPKDYAPNINYHVHDIAKPWPDDWRGKFDLVHQRLVLAAVGPMAAESISLLIETVKPGGYIQLFETRTEVGKDDGMAVQEFIKVMDFAFRQIGYEPAFAQTTLRKCLEDAGLVDVHDHIVPVYLGAKNKDPELAKTTVVSTSIGLAALVGFMKSLPSLPPPLLAIDLDTLVQRFVKELKENGAYFPMHVFWGRKPE